MVDANPLHLDVSALVKHHNATGEFVYHVILITHCARV
jgi:hypothetical protein